MNTKLRTLATLALVVLTTAGLAMAGRGGGGGGGGGHSGGGGGGGGHASGGGGYRGGGGGGYHTPSFSSPRATYNAPQRTYNAPRESYNAPRQGETAGNRSSLPQYGASRTENAAGSRTGADQRPGIANTPSWDNRLNGVNRTNTGGQAYVANRANYGNNFNGNGGNNFGRQGYNGSNYGNMYHGDWNGNWNNNGWNYQPMGWLGVGYGYGYGLGGYLSSIPWSWGYWPYYNPYYSSTVVGGSGFDYSQPIVAAQAAVAPQGIQAGLTAEEQATPLVGAGRTAFMQGDYKTALAQVDQAIAQVPNDPLLHEFRGLVLFALGRYKEAAASDYAVLSAGPGWDWTTQSALYPSVDVYTEQLRALEQYAKANPTASDARFLLADQYLTCGYTDAAATQLKNVVRLNPKDQLSAQLLDSISAPVTADAPAASQPAAPAQAVVASSLVGNWTATRADSGPINLAMAADGTFTWARVQNGKPQQFSGTYSVADNLLELKQNGNPVMVGQVGAVANDRFNFRLPGNNSGDPGLTFAR